MTNTFLQTLHGSGVTRFLGWTLLHSIWGGILLWAVYTLAAATLLRRASAATRYLLAVTTIGMMLLLPIMATIAARTGPAHVPATPLASTIVPAPPAPAASEISPSGLTPSPAARTGTKAVAPTSFAPRVQQPASRPLQPRLTTIFQACQRVAERHLNWLVALWFLGVTLRSAFHLVTWRRLRNVAAPVVPVPLALMHLLEKCRQRIGVARAVSLRICKRVNSPGVIHHFRPVILLPASAVTGLSPEQLEMIFYHELAHVVRRDYLANLLLTTIETLLFYHPCAWALARQVRAEREFACDDLAVQAANGDRVGYSRGLLAVAELAHTGALRPAVAAGSEPFVQRIARLLGVSQRSNGKGFVSMAAALAPLVLAALALLPAVAPANALQNLRDSFQQRLTFAGWRADEKKEKKTLKRDLSRATVRVAGRVLLPDGSPATSCTVTLSDAEAVDAESELTSTTTTLDGSYELLAADRPKLAIQFVQPGMCSVVAVRSNPRVMRYNAAITGTRQLPLDVQLTPGAAVAGVVVGSNGAPASGALVTTPYRGEIDKDPAPAGAEVRTNADGEFLLRDLSSGTVVLAARSPAPGGGVYQGTVTAPATSVTLQLRRTAEPVAGTLFLHPEGVPLTSTTVELIPLPAENATAAIAGQPLSSVTDNAGAYRFDAVPTGKYKLLPQVPGMFLLHDPGEVVVTDSLTSAPQAVQVYRGHTVTGRLIDRETKAPVTGASVGLTGSLPSYETTMSLAVMTGDDGRFALTGVSTQLPDVWVSKEGDLVLKVLSRNYRVADGVNTTLRLNPAQLEMNVDLELERVPLLSGHVITHRGDAAPGAEVRLLATSIGAGYSHHAVRTNENGDYELPGARNGGGRIEAKLAGYAPALSPILAITDTDTSGIDLVLAPGATVRGKVLDADGNPVASAEVAGNYSVEVAPKHTYQREAERELTDATGAFTLTGLSSGTVTLSARSEEELSSYVKCDLRDGESTSGVVLRFPQATAFIGGLVTDQHGKPVPDFSINLRANNDPPTGNRASTTTGADGRYRFDKVPNTSITLSWSQPSTSKAIFFGTTSRQRQVERLNHEDENFTITAEAPEPELPRTTLLGKVVDEKTGLPVREFTVAPHNTSLRVTKGAEGTGEFHVEGIQAKGNIGLRITSEGYGPYDQKVNIPQSGGVLERTFRLFLPGILRGRVVSAATGEPLPRYRVEVQSMRTQYYPPEAKTVTGPDGRFEFADIRTGELQIRVRKPDALITEAERTAAQGRFSTLHAEHGPVSHTGADDLGTVASQQVDVAPEEPTDVGDIAIKREVTVRGRLIRKADRSGIPDINMGAIPQTIGANLNHTNTKTDKDGRFELKGLHAGKYGIQADRHVTQVVDLSDGKDREVVLQSGSATLRGKVLRGGRPVQAWITAQLELPDGTSLSKSDNIDDPAKGFELANMPAGRWSLQYYEFNMSQSGQRFYPSNEVVTIREGESLQRDFHLPAGEVSGTVVNGAGQPVGGAQVALSPLDADSAITSVLKTASGEDGTFAIPNVSAGGYSLTASKEGCGSAGGGRVNFSTGDEKLSGQRLVLRKEGTGSLRSVALSMKTGAGLPKAWCRLYGSEGEFVHDAGRGNDGVMMIPDIPAGEYRVSVSNWGYSVSEQQVRIEPGKETVVEAVLYAAGSVEWTLLTAGQRPVVGAAVTLTPLDATSAEPTRTGTTNKNGVYETRGLGPGQYQAGAEINGKSVSHTFTVKEADHASATSTWPES